MKDNKKKFDDILFNNLISLKRKLSKQEFKKICKFYKWDFPFKKIHIVGTNGKGSNAKYINDELILNKYNVGLFTSPHLISMYERIKINNKNIDFVTLSKFVSILKTDFFEINFGWFDIFFLASLYWFHNKKIDVAIFEAGIGAKKDIVNYIDHDYLLVTSISEDHTKILGNSVYKIANDKSYAIKKFVNVFVSDSIEKEYINILKDKAIKENCNFKIVKTNKKTYETLNISFSKYFLKNIFKINKFKSLFIKPNGRAQEIYINKYQCFLDVSHNYEAFLNTLNFFEIKKIKFEQIVVSLSFDKNFKKIFNFLDKKFKLIYVYENKGIKPLKFLEYPTKYKRIYDLKDFLDKINKKTLFIGSFYLVSEILKILEGD